jgi:hypothetical protein
METSLWNKVLQVEQWNHIHGYCESGMLSQIRLFHPGSRFKTAIMAEKSKPGVSDRSSCSVRLIVPGCSQASWLCLRTEAPLKGTVRFWRRDSNHHPAPATLRAVSERKIGRVISVLRIQDILWWIRIRGSIPLNNGSGSGFGSGSATLVIFYTGNRSTQVYTYRGEGL